MKRFTFLMIAFFYYQLTFAQVPDSTAAPVDSIPNVSATDTVPKPAEPVKQERSFSEKFAFGFGVGFWTNSSYTYVEISPSLAYRFPKRLTTGLGFRYIYRHDKDINNDLHSYGPNVFARVNLTKRIYFWTEYEYLYSQYFDVKIGEDNYTRETGEGDSWFVGLGYQHSIGKSGRGISVQFLYNVLYDEDDRFNPYYSAYSYRIGYFF